jgi:hypothetical protein
MDNGISKWFQPFIHVSIFDDFEWVWKTIEMVFVCACYPIGAGLIPHLWDGFWVINNRYNHLFTIQFHIIKPM